jgi:Zn finger protein HypA/HybF involved in hydrogenase expression
MSDSVAGQEKSSVPTKEKPQFYCQNCGHVGLEEDFVPSDGNPAPFICPGCGSTDVFEREKFPAGKLV